MMRKLIKVVTVLVACAVLGTGSLVMAAKSAVATAVATTPQNPPSGTGKQIILDLTHRPAAAPTSAAAISELWYTFGDGGRTGTSPKYTLSYTTGQATVGKSSSSRFELQRGFWQPFNTSCCQGKRGNLNLTGIVDISDLCVLVSYLTGGMTELVCYEEGNITATGIVDLADLSAFVGYLTGGGFVLPYCP